MTGPRVVVLDDYEGLVSGSPAFDRLRGRVQLDGVRQHLEGDELAKRLQGVPVVVAVRERTRFDRDVFAWMPDAELLLQTGGHAYHVDVSAATEAGILVALGRGSITPSPVVAELVFGSMIAWYRHLVTVAVGMRDGEWPTITGRLLSGRTLGLLGLGRHGAKVARIAAAFGMRVVAWSPHLTPQRAAEVGAEALPLDDVLRTADVVSIHLRLAPATIHLIGERELSLMGPGTLLVNTARGAIIDEDALLRALEARTIEGAVLDVFEVEPLPREHPLRRLSNVLCTSHIGYTVDAAFDDFARTTSAQLEAYLDSDLDPTLTLNPEVAQRRRLSWGGLRDHAGGSQQ